MLSWRKLRSWFKKSDPVAYGKNAAVITKLDAKFRSSDKLDRKQVKYAVDALGGVEKDTESIWKDSKLRHNESKASVLLERARRG